MRLGIVQPCNKRVIGTVLFVRFSVASANLPLGCQATPIIRLAPGTAMRSSTVARSVAIAVISDSKGWRTEANLAFMFVARIRWASGDMASDQGPLPPLRFLIHLSAWMSNTEISLDDVFST